jgi:hypothetical protein
MGSIYSVGGQRWDWSLFLDHDGRYERTVRRHPDYERRDTGRWKYDEAGSVLQLISDNPDESDRNSGGWRVLFVTTCEDSNCLLVFREVILASRNLPILLYRVHHNGRGYGTDWEQRLGVQRLPPNDWEALAHKPGSD